MVKVSTSITRRWGIVENSRTVQRLRNLPNLKKTIIDLLLESINTNYTDNIRYYQRPIEKIAWLIVHVIAIIGMSFMILDATLEYQDSPTVTTMETDNYPVQDIDFPAISICNINKISLSSAIDFAEDLMEMETTTYNVNLTVEELTSMLTMLGHLYLFDIDESEFEMASSLHTILERGYNGYDVSRIMKRLLPKCRSILRQCSWEGKDQDCNQIFFLRRTDNGFCCTFNLARHESGFGNADSSVFASQTIERLRETGPEYGLSVLLNPQLHDYAFRILPVLGFKILIYSSLDYPNTASGGVREVLIPPKVEMFLNLDAISFYSVPSVIDYDMKQRDCLFSSEQAKTYKGHYSYTDCISYCRTRDIIFFCKCIPFFYSVIPDMAGVKICNLKDLPCLKKYKDRWLYVKPRYEKLMVPFNQNNFQATSGYITCDCLPSCKDIKYTVSTSDIPLDIPQLVWNRKKTLLHNHSLVHIYFGEPGTMRMKQDVFLYWYELMESRTVVLYWNEISGAIPRKQIDLTPLNTLGQ
ncbi:hypothetical protein KPH14_005491 [Odynerus spinipes]|uniref:Sodium channel protein Nach n=1 Tax=Odynerus spinipes TaxID=1348599 RepID=A0AAD9VJG2_9HYME|nr:hypothetical protein KPH14_005491 [Odynerus spinipes]